MSTQIKQLSYGHLGSGTWTIDQVKALTTTPAANPKLTIDEFKEILSMLVSEGVITPELFLEYTGTDYSA